MSWRCCGVTHSPSFRHCPYCGTSVLDADRVLVRFPLISGRGDIAVVASAEVDNDSWRFLLRSVQLYVGMLDRRESPSAVVESSARDSESGDAHG